jgi:surfeit locus 1 family protein
MPRRFRPALLPTLVFFLLLAAFSALGLWQVRRAESARALQAEYDRRAAETLTLGARAAAAPELRYRRVRARGVYEPAYQVLIDNRVHDGRPGYDVVTPLRLDAGNMRVLVNRGWVPLGADRRHLPDVPAPAGVQDIEGVAIVPPGKVFTLGPAENTSGAWQTVWQYLDMKRYARAVPFPVQPVVVQLDPQSRAGGFVRAWPRPDAGVAMHAGYAFQWFMLAGTLTVIYLALSMRRPSRRENRR